MPLDRYGLMLSAWCWWCFLLNVRSKISLRVVFGCLHVRWNVSVCVCVQARESVCSRSRLRQLILHHVHCSRCNLCLCSGRSSALKYCVALHVNGLKPYCVYWFGFNKFTCKLGDFESIVSQRWANYSRNEKLDTYKKF